MQLATYDFETHAERGFAALFANASGIPECRTSDSRGDTADEAIILEVEIGGQIDERESQGDFDFYDCTLTIEIRTPKGTDAAATAPFSSTHAELVSRVRHALGNDLVINMVAGFSGVPLVLERCRPTGTEREADDELRTSYLTYDCAFSICE